MERTMEEEETQKRKEEEVLNERGREKVKSAQRH
jgi:hypothetical protein